jgi:hypothetical protein
MPDIHCFKQDALDGFGMRMFEFLCLAGKQAASNKQKQKTQVFSTKPKRLAVLIDRN